MQYRIDKDRLEKVLKEDFELTPGESLRYEWPEWCTSDDGATITWKKEYYDPLQKTVRPYRGRYYTFKWHQFFKETELTGEMLKMVKALEAPYQVIPEDDMPF